MTTKTELTDKQLDILHDHYKETFTRLREAEAMRDRLFLWLIGLFAILIVEIGYPAIFGKIIGKLTVAGGEFNLQALPIAALLNATWVLSLTIGLRYCQSTVLVNRQYPYLHYLEENISPKVGGGNLYQREGKVYLDEYPALLNAAWFAYGILFPLIVIFATIALIFWEYRSDFGLLHRSAHQGLSSWFHFLFNVAIALSLISFFVIYRVQPSLAYRWKKWKEKFAQETKNSQTIDFSI